MGRRSEGLEPEAWLFSMKGTIEPLPLIEARDS